MMLALRKLHQEVGFWVAGAAASTEGMHAYAWHSICWRRLPPWALQQHWSRTDLPMGVRLQPAPASLEHLASSAFSLAQKAFSLYLDITSMHTHW